MNVWHNHFCHQLVVKYCLGMDSWVRKGGGGVVVQWLDYLAVMQEPGVRFLTSEKVASNVAPT